MVECWNVRCTVGKCRWMDEWLEFWINWVWVCGFRIDTFDTISSGPGALTHIRSVARLNIQFYLWTKPRWPCSTDAILLVTLPLAVVMWLYTSSKHDECPHWRQIWLHDVEWSPVRMSEWNSDKNDFPLKRTLHLFWSGENDDMLWAVFKQQGCRSDHSPLI